MNLIFGSLHYNHFLVDFYFLFPNMCVQEMFNQTIVHMHLIGSLVMTLSPFYQ
jgi:hypothetical protein